MEAILDTLEESSEDRRNNHWRFDRSINISAVIAGIVIMWSVISYGNAILDSQRIMTQKVNIMWERFVVDKPELQQMFK